MIKKAICFLLIVSATNGFAAEYVVDQKDKIMADDLGVFYYLVETRDLADGNLMVMSYRDSTGFSGYTARAVDCAAGKSALLSGNKQRDIAESDADTTILAGYETVPLVNTGLDKLGFTIADFACRKVRNVSLSGE